MLGLNFRFEKCSHVGVGRRNMRDEEEGERKELTPNELTGRDSCSVLIG